MNKCTRLREAELSTRASNANTRASKMMSSEAGSVISQKIMRLLPSSKSTIERKTANVMGTGHSRSEPL